MRHFHQHLLPTILIVAACGGRSAIYDMEGAGEDGLEASGGSSSGSGGVGSGGRPGGGGSGGSGIASGGVTSGGGASGSASTGGTNAGGASAGGPATGGFGAGGDPGCPYGSWGDGDECRDWSDCQPGDYLAFFGTSTSDTQCLPCPLESYTSSENQPACVYSGCEFSEIIVEPATPTSPATCEPDPDYVDLGLAYNQWTFGLAASGTRVYLGIAEPAKISLLGYDSGALTDRIELASRPYENTRTFAFAPDGRIYLQGVRYEQTLIPWVDSYARDLSSSWHDTFASLGYDNQSSGFITTDSHWLSWQLERDSIDYDLKVFSSPHPDFTPSEVMRVPALQGVLSVGADDQERLWVLAAQAERTALFRSTGSDPSYESVGFPNDLVPQGLAVSPEGRAYLAGNSKADSDEFVLLELGSDGSVDRSWPFLGDEGDVLTLSLVAVDPERAAFVIFNQSRHDAEEFSFSHANVFALRIDLVTGEQKTKLLRGPFDDWSSYIAVTSDGSAYIAGSSGSRTYVRKVF